MSDKELRELDAWIAEHVFRWEHCGVAPKSTLALGVAPGDGVRYIDEDFRSARYSQIPCFSTDPAAAMEVLKKCAARDGAPTEHNILVYQPLGESAWCVSIDPALCERVIAPTLELAICRFAKQLFSPMSA